MRRFKDAGRTGEVVRVSKGEFNRIINSDSNIKIAGYSLGKGRKTVDRIYRVIENPNKIYYVTKK
ncbi:MAG: hypothetical protein V1818_02610 [Candidatus Aenigmatarchaeota archaeon]